MSKQAYQQVKFLLSAAQLSQLPSDEGIEVAFAGRSNAGKSSALNKLTQQKSLARTSKTPGRTQHINVFTLDQQRRLIDLPGYGYAKVSQAVKEHWQQTLAHYLQQRQCLRGLVLLMDIRHPLTELDQAMIDWVIASQLPTHLLLTKADKLKPGAAKNVYLKIKQALQLHQDLVSIQIFSALTKQGLDELYIKLDTWFNLDEKEAST